MTDPISDMLVRIKNAQSRQAAFVVMPYSKFKHSLAEFFQKNNWLSGVEIEEKDKLKLLKLKLKYDKDGMPVINDLKRVSKPGQRIYSKYDRIPRVRYGFGLTVLSTSKGLMSDKEARHEKLGGEVICQIW